MPCDTKGSVCLHTFKFQLAVKNKKSCLTATRKQHTLLNHKTFIV